MTEFLELLSNPAHWGFEVVTDLLFAGLGALWVKAHDRKHHKPEVYVSKTVLLEMLRVHKFMDHGK